MNFFENLQEEFRKRFSNIKQHEILFKIIENPFQIDENEIPEEYQLEVIDLKTNSSFRDLYRESTCMRLRLYIAVWIREHERRNRPALSAECTLRESVNSL